MHWRDEHLLCGLTEAFRCACELRRGSVRCVAKSIRWPLGAVGACVGTVLGVQRYKVLGDYGLLIRGYSPFGVIIMII